MENLLSLVGNVDACGRAVLTEKGGFLATPDNQQMTDQRQMQEAEEERMFFELAIVQRIERGLATVEDARYVAGAFGLTTEWDRTHKKVANG